MSDQPDAPVTALTLDKITELMAAHVDSISQAAQQLSDIASILKRTRDDEHVLDQWTEKWHFTVTQKHALSRSLHYLALLSQDNGIFDKAQRCKSASEVLKYLDTQRQVEPSPDVASTSSGKHSEAKLPK